MTPRRPGGSTRWRSLWSRPWVQAPARVLLVVLGAAEAVLGVLAHQTTVGLVLAVAAPAVTALAVPGGFTTRLAFCAGWLVAALYLMQQRAEGDFLVSADAHGYVLQGFGVVLLLVSVATVRPLRPPDRPGPDPTDPPAAVRPDGAGRS